jgi:DNA-binding MarR family transcriptional regulator
MITLFILERARTLPPEERQKTMDLMALIKEMQKTSITEVSNITSETFNIDRTTLDKLIADLEAKGKVKRLDENFVKLT